MGRSFSCAIAFGISVAAAGACSVSDGCTSVLEPATLSPRPSSATGAAIARPGDSGTLLGDPGNNGAVEERAGGHHHVVWDGAGPNPFDNMGPGSSAVSGGSTLVVAAISACSETKRLGSRRRVEPATRIVRRQPAMPGLVL